MANSLLEKQISSKVDWSKAQIETSEIDQESYYKNPKDRCCLQRPTNTQLLSEKQFQNDDDKLDDLNDFRPDINAAKKQELFLL